MKTTIRFGLQPRRETAGERRKRYYAHGYLRRKGNHVSAWSKTVIRHTGSITKTEQKWVSWLIRLDYAVCDSLFTTV